MTNLGRKKILLIFIIQVSFFLTTFGQGSGQYLDVPLHGQEQSEWCWAASLEMVLDFHKPNSFDQCDLSRIYQQFLERRLTKNFSDLTDPLWGNCCNLHCPDAPDPMAANNCNQTVQYSERDGKVTLQYMDMILSSIGYNSIEDIDTEWLDWLKIQDELNACRPFIIFLNKVNSTFSFEEYEHAVVAKGYYEYNDAQYMLVNDPQSNPISLCDGCEFLIPINVMSDPTEEMNSALEVVRFIHPRELSVCDTCTRTDNILNNDLVGKVASSISGSDPFFNIDVLSSSNLSDYTPSTPGFQSFNMYYANVFLVGPARKVKIIVSTQTTTNLALILDEYPPGGGGSTVWKTKGITLADCTPFASMTIRVKEPGSENDPDPNPENDIEVEDYDVIEYIPHFYQFYRYKIKGISYLSPVQNYPALPYKKGFSYKQRPILKTLRQLIWQRENPGKKKCFWFSKKYKLNKFE